MVCGDFNVIYLAANNNNGVGCIHHGMRSFRGVIDDLELVEIHLSGHLERLDRALASVEWVEEPKPRSPLPILGFV